MGEAGFRQFLLQALQALRGAMDRMEGTAEMAGMAGMAWSILVCCARLRMVAMVQEEALRRIVRRGYHDSSGYRLACGGCPLLPRRVELQLHLRAR